MTVVCGVSGKLERCKPGVGDGFEPLLSRVVIESVTFRPYWSFFLVVVLLEFSVVFPATWFVQRYLIPSVDIASHTHPVCECRIARVYCPRPFVCIAHGRTPVVCCRVRLGSLISRSGFMGDWGIWVCHVLFKSSSAHLKSSLSGADVVFTFTSEAALSSGRWILRVYNVLMIRFRLSFYLA